MSMLPPHESEGERVEAGAHRDADDQVVRKEVHGERDGDEGTVDQQVVRRVGRCW